jgi:phospholipid-binding lipoprotein MlaA
LRLVDKRAQYLGLDNRLNEMVLDKYSFVRDAYLQKRRAQVRRGPPTDAEDEQENFDRPDKK